jgi:hypothetical protein
VGDVGATVGDAVGLVGALVGLVVGVWVVGDLVVGAWEGARVGDGGVGEGAGVGDTEVGLREGEKEVGLREGVRVGVVEGASVGCAYTRCLRLHHTTHPNSCSC